MFEKELLHTIAALFDEHFKKKIRANDQEEKDHFIVSIETPTEKSITIRVAVENKFINEYSNDLDNLKNSVTEFVQNKINETLKNYERVEYLPEGQRAWVLNL